jgi:ribose-phosphate pyrophosphokinase
VLADPAIDRLAVTDVVPPFRLRPGDDSGKITTLPAAPLLAEAIRRLHQDGDLADLLVF